MQTKIREKYEWSEGLSVDNLTLDDQHKRLIGLINELSTEKAENDSKEFARLLSELTDYFVSHFKDEEAWLELHNYPDLEAHKAEHVKFIYKVAMFNVGCSNSVPTCASRVHSFAVSWLFNHIMDTDLRYRDYFNSVMNTQ